MTGAVSGCFARLGLPADADERAIKRAYAAALKRIDLHRQPLEFQQLRQDYEAALDQARYRLDSPDEADAPDTPDTPPLGTADADATPAPAPADDARQTKDIEALLDALAASPNKAAATDTLKLQLSSGRFDGLAAREALEARLAEAIAQRRFGQSSGHVLMACAGLFGWHTAGAAGVEWLGPWGPQLWRVLDEAQAISPARLARWLALTGPPDPGKALRLLHAGEEPARDYPLLAALLFEPGHIGRWEDARRQANLPSRLTHAGQVLKKRFFQGRRVWLHLGLLVLAVVVVRIVLTETQGLEARRASVDCDRAYSQAIDKKWRGASFRLVSTLSQCAAGNVPPARCEDRSQLSTLLNGSRRLLGHGGRYLYLYASDGDAMLARLPDGRSFGVSTPVQCDAAWQFAAQGTWLQEGDAKAAYRFVADLAACPMLAGKDKPLVRAFLEHTDAWPASQRPKERQLASLAAVVARSQYDAVPMSPPERPAEPHKPWPACLSEVTEADMRAIGPLEGAAIRASDQQIRP